MSVDHATRQLVLARAEGFCEVCSVRFARPHLHHRKPRGMGGGGDNSAANLIAVHPSCHLYRIESRREEALANGWLVRQGHDPSEVPMTYRLTRKVLLTKDGRIEEVT